MPVLLCLVFSLILAILLRENIYFISIKDLSFNVQTLLSVSSIVFAVIGAWIALIYPSAIKNIVSNNNDIENNENEANRLASLIKVAITSSAILVIVIILSLMEPIIPLDNKYINAILFFILTNCSLMQVYSVMKVVLMNYHLLSNLRNKSIKDFKDNVYR